MTEVITATEMPQDEGNTLRRVAKKEGMETTEVGLDHEWKKVLKELSKTPEGRELMRLYEKHGGTPTNPYRIVRVEGVSHLDWKKTGEVTVNTTWPHLPFGGKLTFDSVTTTAAGVSTLFVSEHGVVFGPTWTNWLHQKIVHGETASTGTFPVSPHQLWCLQGMMLFKLFASPPGMYTREEFSDLYFHWSFMTKNVLRLDDKTSMDEIDPEVLATVMSEMRQSDPQAQKFMQFRARQLLVFWTAIWTLAITDTGLVSRSSGIPLQLILGSLLLRNPDGTPMIPFDAVKEAVIQLILGRCKISKIGGMTQMTTIEGVTNHVLSVSGVCGKIRTWVRFAIMMKWMQNNPSASSGSVRAHLEMVHRTTEIESPTALLLMVLGNEFIEKVSDETLAEIVLRASRGEPPSIHPFVTGQMAGSSAIHGVVDENLRREEEKRQEAENALRKMRARAGGGGRVVSTNSLTRAMIMHGYEDLLRAVHQKAKEGEFFIKEENHPPCLVSWNTVRRWTLEAIAKNRDELEHLVFEFGLQQEWARLLTKGETASTLTAARLVATHMIVTESAAVMGPVTPVTPWSEALPFVFRAVADQTEVAAVQTCIVCFDDKPANEGDNAHGGIHSDFMCHECERALRERRMPCPLCRGQL